MPQTGAARGALDAEPREAMLSLFRDMLLIRRFEEKAGQLYGMGLIGGFCHLCIGQEAVCAGVAAAAAPEDSRIASYRAHGHMLACGMDPAAIMAELTGRVSGISRGKGGSMHMFDPEKKFYGGHGIVGAQVPIAAGIAFAETYRKGRGVCFVFYGDRAADQGQVAEAMRMAQLWKLPMVFVIENNRDSEPIAERAKAPPPLHRRSEAFGIPSAAVDGMDVIAVRDAAAKAALQARIGKGPQCLEMKTYRYRGHALSGERKRQALEEAKQVRENRDPVETFRLRLLDGGHADAAALRKIDAEIRAIVQEAARFAQESPEPDASELSLAVTG